MQLLGDRNFRARCGEVALVSVPRSVTANPRMNPTAHSDPTLPSRRSILGSVAMCVATAVSGQAQELDRPIAVGSTSIDVQFLAGGFDLTQDEIRAWVASCAQAVAGYLGAFPVRQARVEIHASSRPRGIRGRSWGDGGARCRIDVGLHSSREDLNRDWVLTHEMLHFAFPSVPRRNSWIEEGISTYVEPIARAKAGLIPVELVWAEMIRDMPQGLPTEGDQGLDNTHTWGRTYWGGAIFCLLADIRVRQATNNRKGLPDALRAINLAGGNITVEWPLAKALEVADRALGVLVLSDLHSAMGPISHPVNLGKLLAKLGVASNGSKVTFDNSAKMAATRRAILGEKFR